MLIRHRHCISANDAPHKIFAQNTSQVFFASELLLARTPSLVYEQNESCESESGPTSDSIISTPLFPESEGYWSGLAITGPIDLQSLVKLMVAPFPTKIQHSAVICLRYQEMHTVASTQNLHNTYNTNGQFQVSKPYSEMIKDTD